MRTGTETKERSGRRLDWLASATGRSILADERAAVARALEGVFGDYLVQVGCWGPKRLFIRNARVRFSFVLAGGIDKEPDAQSLPEELAVASDSVDAVILPHALERSDDPYALLREVNRILRPEGHLIVLAFNPSGWWGLRHLCSRRRFPPGTSRLIGDKRLADWLQLLGYASEPASYHGLTAPFIQERHTPADRIGSQRQPDADNAWWRRAISSAEGLASYTASKLQGVSVFSASYVLVARKRLYTLTPVRQLPTRKRALVGGLVNPTTRNVA